MEHQPNEWIEHGELERVVDAICERADAATFAALGRILLQVRSNHE